MVRWWAGWVLSLTVWLAAVGLGVAAEPSGRAPADPTHQVLVLLRLPPEHFRPNSDYGESYGEGVGRSARRRIASRIAHDHGLVLASDWPLPLVGLDCFVMTVPADQSVDQVAAALSHDPEVDWSEPMKLYHGQSSALSPNDPLFRVQPAAAEWRLADLHVLATGRGVRVAVVDSQVETTHPDLAGQIVVNENFVLDQPDSPEQHGTGVAGIIAARANNGVGIVGVAPQARLMALRACWQTQEPTLKITTTVCDSLSLAKALHFAITHDAQVINLSLSGPADPLLDRLLDAALTRGVTVVGAYDPSLAKGGFPASHIGVVPVMDESLGDAPDGVFTAPGRDVPTTQPGGRWFLVSGSSFAAAHVSGLFALLHEHAAWARTASALVTGAPRGAIDACATLVRAMGPCGCACGHAQQYSAIARQ
jgi:hypothetical protein